jgi:hypothetical protein
LPDAHRLPRFILRAALVLASIFVLVVDASAGSAASTAAAASPQPVNPNTLGRGAGDAVVIVRWLAPGKYQLDVQNTSGIGYINQFVWTPPQGMTVTAVTSSEGGRCSLVNGDIQCNGNIQPPACTCLAGGDLTVNFTATGLDPTFANGYWTYHGMVGAYLEITEMTPVPYHIPSSLSLVSDEPLCKKGQTSTKTKPCV